MPTKTSSVVVASGGAYPTLTTSRFQFRPFVLADIGPLAALKIGSHPKAGRVLAGIGMEREGLVRKRVFEGGQLEDLVCWAILSSDWQQRMKS